MCPESPPCVQMSRASLRGGRGSVVAFREGFARTSRRLAAAERYGVPLQHPSSQDVLRRPRGRLGRPSPAEISQRRRPPAAPWGFLSSRTAARSNRAAARPMPRLLGPGCLALCAALRGGGLYRSSRRWMGGRRDGRTIRLTRAKSGEGMDMAYSATCGGETSGAGRSAATSSSWIGHNTGRY